MDRKAMIAMGIILGSFAVLIYYFTSIDLPPPRAPSSITMGKPVICAPRANDPTKFDCRPL